MWTEETIFSEGDLLSGFNYAWFIVDEYGHSDTPYYDRYLHVQEMIKRLEAERIALENLIKKHNM